MMDIDPEISKSTRVKSCDHCRQNKLRCDASRDTSDPCSRCRRRGLKCTISAAFVRTKRRTKSELQAEIDSLKQRVQPSPQNGSVASPSSNPRSHASIAALSPPGPSSLSTIRGHSSKSPASIAVPPSNLSINPALPPTSKTPVADYGDTTANTTSVRTLAGVTVNAAAIEDCFALFSDKYLPQMPIFEAVARPNLCHQQSQLLFWSIVAIGSRKYAQDPTLLTLLASPLVDLAKTTAFAREAPISTIQALLLLCMWPMPFDTLSKDIAPMLSGLIVQHALSIGLHIFGVGQDFSRVKVAWDRAQTVLRARLWALTIATCQRVSFTDGIPPLSVPDNYDHEYCRSQALSALTPSIGFQKTLNQIQTDAILETQRFALSKKPEQRAAALNPILETVTSQLSQLTASVTCELDGLYLTCGQLQIQTFYLFAPSASIEDSNLVRMYDLACAAIEIAIQLDQTHNYAEHAPMPVSKYLHLAAFTILKMTRSRVQSSLDLPRGQTAYFAVIQIHRKMSLQNGDVAARSTSILTQLWTSRNVFKQPDGTIDSLTLRCGSRLAMSVVFDLYWWWRQEFAGLPNPYEEKAGEDVAEPSSAAKPDIVATTVPELDSDLLGADFWSWQDNFPEFAWPSQADLTRGGWLMMNDHSDPSLNQLPGNSIAAAWM